LWLEQEAQPFEPIEDENFTAPPIPKAENSFSAFNEWQFGQVMESVRAAETSSSNSSPQSRQAYSNIGISD
jgi:hypothetical protein